MAGLFELKGCGLSHATPLCLCVGCNRPVQQADLALVLVLDDGKPLVNVTSCIHAACERAFFTKYPPTRGARWMTFPLARFLATLLKNATSLEGAAAPQPIGH